MYVIQTAKDGKIWEQVDEYTFVNRKYALNNEGSPRYTNNWIKTEHTSLIAQLVRLN